jgi:small subunit ribosomal protein S21
MRNNNNMNRGRSVDLTPQKRHPKDKRPSTPMPFDIGLRKFKKNVENAGILKELRAREFYEKPTSKRKRKKAEAVKRHQKKISSDLNAFNARGQRHYK